MNSIENFWDTIRKIANRAPTDPAMRAGVNLNPKNFITIRDEVDQKCQIELWQEIENDCSIY